MEDNKMATMSMNKLILKSGIPVMFSLSLQAVYNIVDSAFVSNMDTYGEEGLHALFQWVQYSSQYLRSCYKLQGIPYIRRLHK